MSTKPQRQKQCTKCLEYKSVDQFYRLASARDGRRPDCKACERKPARKTALVDRFWDKVDRRGPNDCWNWTAGTNGEYGRLRVGIRKVQAHRYSWELHNGKIPRSLFVLHKCDNPLCVNPNHLFLGDNQANMQDMVAKGRNSVRRGEQCNKSKLTKDDVRTIRRLYASGKHSQYALADMFGVGQPCIKDVVNRITWKHVK